MNECIFFYWLQGRTRSCYALPAGQTPLRLQHASGAARAPDEFRHGRRRLPPGVRQLPHGLPAAIHPTAAAAVTGE